MYIHDIVSIPLFIAVTSIIACIVIFAILEMPDIINTCKNENINFWKVFVELMNDWFGSIENAN